MRQHHFGIKAMKSMQEKNEDKKVLTNETGVFSILFDLEANSNLSSGTIKYKFSYNVDGVVKYFYVTINIKL